MVGGQKNQETGKATRKVGFSVSKTHAFFLVWKKASGPAKINFDRTDLRRIFASSLGGSLSSDPCACDHEKMSSEPSTVDALLHHQFKKTFALQGAG